MNYEHKAKDVPNFTLVDTAYYIKIELPQYKQWCECHNLKFAKLLLLFLDGIRFDGKSCQKAVKKLKVSNKKNIL